MQRIIVLVIGGAVLMFAPNGPSLNGQSPNPLLPANAAREYIRLGGRLAAVDSFPGVPNEAPQVTSVSPSSGSGSSQTFEFTFTDANGYADIEYVLVLIHDVFTGADACYVMNVGSAVGLAEDAHTGTEWLGPVSLGTSASVQNSQCRLNALSSSVAGNGGSLTLQLDFTFFSAFAGAKWVWAYVEDYGGLNSNWQLVGSWTVP